MTVTTRKPLLLAALAAWCALVAAEPAPIFVLNSLDASVSIIDPARWEEVRRLPTGTQPHHLYLTPDGRSLIVADARSDSLTFIDPRTAQVQRVLRGILDPYQLRFSADMRWFVTAANHLNHVDIYRRDGSALQLAGRVATGKTPSHIWINAGSTTAFVSMQESDEVVAIDLATQSLRWRLRTGSMPADIYGSADDRTLLVALTGSDGVEILDITGPRPRSVGRIRTGKGAHAFRAAGDRRHVFVSNRVDNTISKLDLLALKVVDSYPAPGGPDCIDVLADGRTLLVTSRWAHRLTVVDTQTHSVVRQVKVGSSPHGVWTLDHAAH